VTHEAAEAVSPRHVREPEDEGRRNQRPRIAPELVIPALARHYKVTDSALDGWQVAEELSRVGAEIPDPELKEEARKLAVKAVLQRAHRLVGPIRPARRMVYEPMQEPHRGEMNVERTLEAMAGKPWPERQDWIIERRENKHQQVVLMMDVSLSMSGRNLALAALAGAVLALKLPPEDLSVVAFDSTARVLTRLNEMNEAEDVVRAILCQPARGFTNLEAALETGCREIERGQDRRRAGLLITDGVYTVGGDPTPLAARFPQLFVLLTEDERMDPALCRRMANAGRGDVFSVAGFDELPDRMLDLANRLLR
jgi:Mg-chelatase subunit ChlD